MIIAQKYFFQIWGGGKCTPSPTPMQPSIHYITMLQRQYQLATNRTQLYSFGRLVSILSHLLLSLDIAICNKMHFMAVHF